MMRDPIMDDGQRARCQIVTYGITFGRRQCEQPAARLGQCAEHDQQFTTYERDGDTWREVTAP